MNIHDKMYPGILAAVQAGAITESMTWGEVCENIDLVSWAVGPKAAHWFYGLPETKEAIYDARRTWELS